MSANAEKYVREFCRISLAGSFLISSLSSHEKIEMEAKWHEVQWPWLNKLAKSIIPVLEELFYDFEVSLETKEVTLISNDHATAELRILVKAGKAIPDDLWAIAENINAAIMAGLSRGKNENQLSLLGDFTIPYGYDDLFSRCLNGAMNSAGGTQVPEKTLVKIGKVEATLTGRTASGKRMDRPDDIAENFQGVMEGFIRGECALIVKTENGATLKITYDPLRDYPKILSDLNQSPLVKIKIKGTYLKTHEVKNKQRHMLMNWSVVENDEFKLE